MVTAGLAILMGVILACFQQQSIDIYWVSLLPVCLFFIYFRTPGRYFWLLMAGFLYASLHIHLQLQQRPAESLNNQSLLLTGEIIDIPRYANNSARFIFQPDQHNKVQGLPGRIRLSWKNPAHNLQAGQRWRLKVKFKTAHGFQNPGGFDYERWLFVNRIHATGYVKKNSGNRLLEESAWSVNRLRQHINAWIREHCEDCRYTSLILALSTGYRGDMSAAERKLFQTTGTAHLIAISGLHIGIIAAVVFFLSRKLWNVTLYFTGWKRNDFAWLLSWIAVLIYSLLSGFQLPAQRAFLMFSVLGLMLLLRLPVNLLNSVMTTLLAVLVFTPLAVLSESFWLTLSAMGIILLGSFILPNQTSRWRQLLYIQWLFSLLFIPLTMIIFAQVHSASLFANLIAVPLVSLVIVPLNFILLGLFFLPHSWLNHAYSMMDGLVGLLVGYLHLLQNWGLQAIQLPVVSGWKILLIVLCLLMVVLPRGMIRMRGWWILLPALIIWPSGKHARPPLTVTVLDVGTGNAIVIETQYHSLIYDFGPGNRWGYSTGDWVVMPFLREEGIQTLDSIVISHTDQDHSGGLYAVIDRVGDTPVVSGTPDSLLQNMPELKSVQNCHQKSSWRWDGVEFEFLNTHQAANESENNRSCVLRISLKDEVILLAGDIEASQEKLLLDEYPDKLPATVLLAPHHGSTTSSSEAFIRAVAPQHVIFSSGYLNRWKFPRQQIVQRYQRIAANLYRTDEDGAIQIECTREDCEVEKFRQRYPRIWY